MGELDDLPGELWCDIPGYEGLYQGSNLGRIKSKFRRVYCKRGYKKNLNQKILRSSISNAGYKRVCLSKNNKKRNFSVHRLICAAFFGESKLIVNHKDGIKTNNNISNLEYCSYSQNIKHAFDIGISRRNEIICIENGKVYTGCRHAAKDLGLDESSIYKVASGKRKTCGGFRFKFK